MASKSTIEERAGKTVLVVPVSSEARAKELDAAIENERLRTEGGFWDGARARIDMGLRICSQILETLDRSFLVLISVAFGLVAGVLAMQAWPAFVSIEGLDWLIAFAGGVLVFAIGAAAHQVYRAFAEKDDTEAWGLICGIVIGIALNAIASIALQARISIENDTGWTETQARIETLQTERGGLAIQTYAPPPPGRPQQIGAAIAALRAQPATNSLGDALPRSVGQLVGDCSGEEDFYSRRYCPEIRRQEGLKAEADAAAAAFAAAQARITAIDDEIGRLQAARPKPPAGLDLLRFALGDWATLAPFIPPSLFSVFTELMMVLFGVLAGRRSWRRRQAA